MGGRGSTTPRMRKRPVSDTCQIRIRWIILLFLMVNVGFVVYVYNAAFACNSSGLQNYFSPTTTATTAGTASAVLKTSFTQWLEDNRNTPGARFVKLLKEHLHPHVDAEGERLVACHDKNYPLCFAGHGPYQKALQTAPSEKKDDKLYIERTTMMPYSPVVDGEVGYSVWLMRRFAKLDRKHRIIHNLGTEPACLALLLAGVAVADFGVVIELGTFLGLSSKCIGMGLNATQQKDSFLAFDLFGNDDYNYEKIIKAMPWTLQVMPEFKKESSYQWLWRAATVDAYPSAQAFEGFINSSTLHPKLWHKKPIALLSVDSAKTWSAFRDQTAGIQRPYMLKKGAILILMDFITIDTQIKLLYTGCLGKYLQPVYSSFSKGEQWIFVVIRSFNLGMVSACMQDFLGDDRIEPTEAQYKEMVQRASDHVNYLDNFGSGPLSTSMVMERKTMMERLITELKDSPMHWKYLCA